ncbi:hypothetical protein BDF20DRAFT_917527 [Mycotypha africana]|uniref:uncharacterized protein n=1 Tax=Mycotypha africana TaxID=64632 RepID=UPI002300F1E1|nr:uncharacterized protein BDF20DRAFT_917527 [Mycotypha africana]KAI8967599.1 hypothetical protein BDF20DRAFT_917527 [Mycotypha africana]
MDDYDTSTTPVFNHSLSSPLIAVTGALACIAWLILFVGACVAGFHGTAWWIIIYELAFLVFVFVVLGLNQFGRFHNMVWLFMAVSLVYLTWLCQFNLNFLGQSGARAAAGGAIILLIIEFIWAIELTAPGGGTRMSLGSLGGAKEKINARIQRSRIGPHGGNKNSNYEGGNKPLPRRFDEENAVGGDNNNSQYDANHTEQVTALHAYKGSVDDPNELSFEKGDVLEILDKSGNWWQARKQDGSTGIVPSNYFE